MHPTADTPDFKYLNLAWRRVMPGVWPQSLKRVSRRQVIGSQFTAD
jgi:hypothetical protein